MQQVRRNKNEKPVFGLASRRLEIYTGVLQLFLKNASEAMENMNRSSKFLHSCFNEVEHRKRLGVKSSTWYNSLFG